MNITFGQLALCGLAQLRSGRDQFVFDPPVVPRPRSSAVLIVQEHGRVRCGHGTRSVRPAAFMTAAIVHRVDKSCRAHRLDNRSLR